LITFELEALQNSGPHVVFVFGDPSHYGRFGSRSDLAEPFSAPNELTFPSGWQVLIPTLMGHGRQSLSITCVAALNRPDLW
jgi:putative acetyltransferase